MGVTGLWEMLGPGELTSIAALSTEHFCRTGRPFRIAVDEPGWRFNNLNDGQVAHIRMKSGRQSNPLEKHIFYRLSKLLRLNVQPIFIFDGPSRPWKRGKRGGNRIDHDRTRLLIKMLDQLRIPHHRAPAEAEAECAHLQMEGVVDAVWSDDGDTLMFGATMLVREHREGGDKRGGGKKSDTHVRVWRAEDLERQHGLKPRDLVIFTLLSGGDYDLKGLPGCGPVKALKATQWKNCQLSELLDYTEGDKHKLAVWRLGLEKCLADLGTNIPVPVGFPRDLAVNNYRRPKVSSSEQLNNLRGLRQGWDRPINEATLRPFMREQFDFWARGYIKHVVPMLLVKKLRAGLSAEEKAAVDLQLVRKRGKKTPSDAEALLCQLETKITYRPNSVSALDLGVQPIDEDWSELTTQKDGVFDPHKPVELEVLNVLLEAGLGGAGVADPCSEPVTAPAAPSDAPIATPPAPASAKPRKRKQDPATKPAAREPKKRSKTHVETPAPRSTESGLSHTSSPSLPKSTGFRRPMGLDEILGPPDARRSPLEPRPVPALSRCSTKSSADQPPDLPALNDENFTHWPLLGTSLAETPCYVVDDTTPGQATSFKMLSSEPVVIDLTLD